jgi:hypothetical protein
VKRPLSPTPSSLEEKMSAQNLFLEIKMPNAPAAQRRWRMTWTNRIRRIVQFGFAAFILYAAVAHNLATEDGTTASIDALCPMGGIETLWRFVTTGGTQFVSKTHLSNIVLALGLLIGVLIAGGAFCGWVCPFGAVQDVMNWLRGKLRLKEIHVPEKLDRVLRYGRFVVLALILQQTISLTKLWLPIGIRIERCSGWAGCSNSISPKVGSRTRSSSAYWASRSSSSARGVAICAHSVA